MNFVNLIIKKIKSYPLTAKISNPVVSHFTKDSNIQLTNTHYFPQDIKEHILEHTKYIVKYETEKTSITFYTFENTIQLQSLNKHVKLMLCWISIAEQYSIYKCNDRLNVIIYLTPLKKILPKKGQVLSSTNCNTGFSSLCNEGNEITIYRKEEWFKVFLHESFHYFGFDYSNMDVSLVHQELQHYFCIKTDILLFESYTEFFAEIIHLCFYCVLNNKKFESCIEKEIRFSIQQTNKVLNHMELTYDDFFDNCNEVGKKYKEDTNCFSYYILKTILLFYWKDFLRWCNTNNTNILTFSQNNKQVIDFCNFIKSKSNEPSLLSAIHLSGNNLNNTTDLRMTSFDI